MKLSEVKIGMRVRREYTLLNWDGTETVTFKPPVYTVTDIDEYGCVEYTVKGGKRWSCHPSYLHPVA